MSAAGYARLRLRSLQAARGWLGLARFLATRLLRTQSDVVFERRLAKERTEIPAFGEGRRMVMIDRQNLDDPAQKPLLAQLLVGESAAYRRLDGLANLATSTADRIGVKQTLKRTMRRLSTGRAA